MLQQPPAGSMELSSRGRQNPTWQSFSCRLAPHGDGVTNTRISYGADVGRQEADLPGIQLVHLAAGTLEE